MTLYTSSDIVGGSCRTLMRDMLNQRRGKEGLGRYPPKRFFADIRTNFSFGERDIVDGLLFTGPTMLKIITFAFLSCGIVSAASAMGGWIATPGGVFGPEPPASALTTFNEAFLLSLGLLTGAGMSVYLALKE